MVDVGDQATFARRREAELDTGHEWHHALPKNSRVYLPTENPSYYPEIAGWLRYLADEITRIAADNVSVGASKIELGVVTSFVERAMRERKPSPKPYRETRTMLEIGTSYRS